MQRTILQPDVRRASGSPNPLHRRLPVGAEVQAGGGVHFRVWAPDRHRVAVVLEQAGASWAAPLEAEAEAPGYFSALVPAAQAGTLYRYRLDDAAEAYPDPASRAQPDGPHGASEVVDPAAFCWTDADWRGVRLPGQVLYELHVGTFTREGTWEAAARALPALADLGVSVLEVMPVAEFPGRFGWGYDGVDLLAPSHLYGSPDDMRRFVDHAHTLGLGVILDVVYNHLGPDGSYLTRFAEAYFTDRYETDWGDPMNFDGPDCGPVRDFILANAAYWIAEFHLDGLRLDATQCIFDASLPHIVGEIGATVRRAAAGRDTIVVAENEPQQVQLVRPAERGGHGLDALWNDDLHHSAMVALTGRAEAYYSDHRGSPQELVSAIKYGALFQGQRYSWQRQRRGTPALDLPPATWVTFLQNHDQVANSARGLRVHHLTSPGRLRALTALLLLAPGTPMLFQGQEWAASSPFLYFADHHGDLAAQVREGRRVFLEQFPSVARLAAEALLSAPEDPATFERCRLDHAEQARAPHAQVLALHRDLLALRRADPVFRAQRPRGVDGAVLGTEAFVLRFFGEQGDDRLLLVNLGADLALTPAPEPLLAPPEGCRWTVRWASEDPRYGGSGAPAPESEESGWQLQGQAAMVLLPAPWPQEGGHPPSSPDA